MTDPTLDSESITTTVSGAPAVEQSAMLPWYRFTLRRLLYWVFLISVPVAWIGWDYNKVQAHRRAVAVVEGLGGRIKYTHTLGTSPHPPPGLVPLRRLLGDDYFFKVVKLDLSGTQVRDADLEALAGLRDVKVLLLNDTKITDAGLPHLWRIGLIEVLELRNTKITDQGLKDLGQMNPLSHLNIEGTEVTDAGLEHLKNMPKFSTVTCRGTHVTLRGAAELKRSYSRPVGVGWSRDFPAEPHRW